MWVLHGTTDTEVIWRRDDGVIIGFAREGFGEPWSGEDEPPDSIDTYAPPRQEGPALTMRPITKFAFRQRFTQAERVAVEMAAIDDPTASASARQFAAALRAQLRDFEVAQQIALDHPETVAGIQALEQYGLIGPGRADEVLLTPPTDAEAVNA